MVGEPNDPDWLKFEKQVLRLFQTTGYECEHNVRIQGVRGTHQVDVLVHVPAVGRHQRWVVECKRRGRPVTKADLMVLRSVVDDAGASHGYLIAEHGAQRGAYDYATKSNLTVASTSELEAELRLEQLKTASSTADDLELRVTFTEKDHGNFDSEAVVTLRSTEGRSIGDRLVELVIEKRLSPQRTWCFSTDDHPQLRVETSELKISLPWDPIRWLGLHLDDFIFLDGGSVDGPYRVVMRTTSGPLSLVAVVPWFK